jgi:outer membrane biosynthesis protein TonB
MFCENCGNPIPEDSKFCLNCGAKTESVEAGGEVIQETAIVTDEVVTEKIPDTETVLQTEQQPAPAEQQPAPVEQQPAPTELIQSEPQPKPVPPVAQPKPVPPVAQPKPVPPVAQPELAKPAPKPEAPRYAQEPVAQNQNYQQNDAPMQPETTKKDKPLPTWKFVGILLLGGIPIVNLIMILVWSFGKSWNRNTKSYARAVLILLIISFLLTIAAVIINLEALRNFVDYFNSTYEINFS